MVACSALNHISFPYPVIDSCFVALSATSVTLPVGWRMNDTIRRKYIYQMARKVTRMRCTLINLDLDPSYVRVTSDYAKRPRNNLIGPYILNVY